MIQLIFVLILLVVSSFALYGVAYIDENDPTNDYDNVYTALKSVHLVKNWRQAIIANKEPCLVPWPLFTLPFAD